MDQHHELLVIGAGQMRTGTTSLKNALQILYGGKCYHMDELLRYHKDHVKIWINALNQGFLDKNLSAQLFQGYIAAVDYPAASFYNDLMTIYPNAKVILSTRNATEWVKSVRNTTVSRPSIFTHFKWKLIFFNSGLLGFEEMREKYFLKSLGKPMRILQRDDEILKRCFEEYNEEVRRTVPKDRLLEFDSKDGWEPLCKFLDLPIPDEPYPFLNNSSDFNHEINTLFWSSVLKYGAIIAVAVTSSIFLYRKWR